MSSVMKIARKELSAFFSSPVAFIFLGTFLFINLFIFFWVETFFARNLADIRPLFSWMPILLIFLVAALTMRMWSDERRMGTFELLLTLPVKGLNLVAGKYFSCMLLVGIALALTLPLPVTVAFMGDLDWGPVIGGYVATLFLAGSYTAIGLFISSKTDNQIVSLIVTVLLCSLLYLVGSDALTPFVGNELSEIFRLFGSGSRFESITRGVLDFRDIYYYLSIIGIFLCLNVYSLERLRWAAEKSKPLHTQWNVVTLLFVVNFFIGNFWLQHVRAARVDMTAGNMYSISDATKSYLNQLQEPLLIRGYFSKKTHPLLAPLYPQLRDLAKEYEVAGEGKVRVEFIDPREHEELEQEANQKYGIKPVPFQVADKYQAALVNSYFDLLVKYGDKYEVLNFQDFIEVKVHSENNIDVKLRNPEYDITRSIKKVLYGFQGTDHLFASMASPVKFVAYVSADSKLPAKLADFKPVMMKLVEDLKADAGDKLEIEVLDPESTGGAVAEQIAQDFGFRPMAASLFDTEGFYFYMTLQQGDQVVQIPLPESLDEGGARRGIEAGLKRFSVGFLKTVGLVTPPATPANPYLAQMGMGQPEGKKFEMARQKLSENYQVKPVDLKKGIVPEDVDLLLIAAPKALSEIELFAIDQFLMKGGTIVLSTAPFTSNRSQQALSVEKNKSGLEEWLKSYGISFEEAMVLDRQNEDYPIPVQRQLGGFAVQELRLIPYPYFVDIRSGGMNQDVSILSGVPQLTLNWASPLVLDESENKGRKVTSILKSSEDSWTSDSLKVVPDFRTFGELGFPTSPAKGPYTLAAIVEGEFSSFFKDKKSPLLQKYEEDKKAVEEAKRKAEGEEANAAPPPPEPELVLTSAINKSPTSGRLIIYGSNDWISDEVLRISASTGSSRYLNSLQLVENSIDWSLEDRGLLTIRSRGHFARTLIPLESSEQMFWEYLNYGLAILGLLMVFLIDRSRRGNFQARYQDILAAAAA